MKESIWSNGVGTQVNYNIPRFIHVAVGEDLANAFPMADNDAGKKINQLLQS